MAGVWTRDLFTSRESKEIAVQDQPLNCLFCHHNKFYTTKVAMNQRWLSWFNYELFSSSGRAYTCERCGFKHEFYK
jgi:hypothetical protein